MNDLKAVMFSDLPAGEKVLWAQLYIVAGYKRMTAPLLVLCDELGMNRAVTRKHMYRLRDRGALIMERRYKTGEESGCMGSSYQLMPIESWLGGNNGVEADRDRANGRDMDIGHGV